MMDEDVKLHWSAHVFRVEFGWRLLDTFDFGTGTVFSGLENHLMIPIIDQFGLHVVGSGRGCDACLDVLGRNLCRSC